MDVGRTNDVRLHSHHGHHAPAGAQAGGTGRQAGVSEPGTGAGKAAAFEPAALGAAGESARDGAEELAADPHEQHHRDQQHGDHHGQQGHQAHCTLAKKCFRIRNYRLVVVNGVLMLMRIDELAGPSALITCQTTSVAMWSENERLPDPVTTKNRDHRELGGGGGSGQGGGGAGGPAAPGGTGGAPGGGGAGGVGGMGGGMGGGMA